MSPAEELTQLYAQWRDLTEQEGAAIRRCAWPEVAQYQAAKNRLQPRIVEISGQLEAVALERQFRRVVDTLIALERRNAVWTEERWADAQAEAGQFARSARSLRQLQRLYLPPPRQNWQSYS